MAPQGSLVYQRTVDNVLIGSSDVDTYTLAIDPQQTLAVLVTPVTPDHDGDADPDLPDRAYHRHGDVSLTRGPRASCRESRARRAAPTRSGSAGGAGEYTIQPTLNALLDPASFGGPPNDSIATAQPIDPYANKFIANADRTAVLGTIGGSPVQYGDAIVVESSDVILINRNTGKIVERITSPAFSGLFLFDAALAPDNTFYVLGDVNDFTGVIIHMDLQGDTLGTITLPVSDSPGFLSPEGFGLDPRDGSFWIPLSSTAATLVHIDSSGNLLGEYYVGGNPDDAAVGPDGHIYISQVFRARSKPSIRRPARRRSSPHRLSPRSDLERRWRPLGRRYRRRSRAIQQLGHSDPVNPRLRHDRGRAGPIRQYLGHERLHRDWSTSSPPRAPC